MLNFDGSFLFDWKDGLFFFGLIIVVFEGKGFFIEEGKKDLRGRDICYYLIGLF